LIHECPVVTYASTLTFSPDGRRLLVGPWGTISQANFPALWDVSAGTQIARLEGHKSDTQLQGATFSHDGRRIATVSLDGSARIWDGKSGTLLDVLGQESPDLKLSDIGPDDSDQEMNSAFSPDDRLLATASMNGPIRIWDVGRASLFATITGHRALIEHLEFNPVDSNILLTASHDGTARLWDLRGILTTALRHEYPPTFAVFSPDSVHLLTGGGDTKVHLWDVATESEVAKLDTHHETADSATFSPDGTRVATASFSGRVLIWDVASRSEIAQLKFPVGLRDIQFSPKGDLLAASSAGGTARLWNAATGAEVATIKTSGMQVVFSRDGNLVLAATSDHAAHLLKTDGTELRVLTGHDSRITGAAFSPDGQLVATASVDRTARIWSVRDGSTVAILRGHGDELTAVAFSPDGQSLLTASRDGTARIWNVLDGKERFVLKGHSGVVNSAQFSPNGLYVLTASTQDRTVRLWAARTGREMAELAGLGNEENNQLAPIGAAFNSDGTRVVIVSYKGYVRVTRVFQTLQDLIDFAKQTVPRELTACERRRFFLPVEGDVSDCPGALRPHPATISIR
jgi:WD40 repeat protein